MNVYPSHRTAALPQHEYELIREEAAKLELNGDSMVNYQKTSVPFPIPKSGLEAMWNHLTRYRTGGFLDYPTEMVVQANGSFYSGAPNAKICHGLKHDQPGAEPAVLFLE
ncbi:DUF1329 domain-containing protein [Pseudomonas aeruginosa]|nr:DUF1329 domain-containing protein [Pseudomonas aeruginosa]